MPTRRPATPTHTARPRQRGLASFCLFFIVLVFLVGAAAALLVPGLLDNRSAEAYLPQPHEPYQGNLLAGFFSPSVLYWGNQIETWAADNGLDPNLAAAVMQIESCGDPLARSGAGASGLFQVMPFHFQPGEDVYEPETNALRGLKYLATTLNLANGDIRLALAGYNGGLTVMDQPEADWPAETRRYAAWGSGVYAEAVNGSAASETLKDWLRHGGTRLCWQAERRLGIR